MKFSAAVLALALVGTKTDAFVMPSTRVHGVSSFMTTTTTTSLMSAKGASFIKFLLVPNAKQTAPAAAPIPFKDLPDVALDAPVFADSATAAVTAADPVSQASTTSQVVAATARRAAKVKEEASAPPVVESPPPPVVESPPPPVVQEALTQPSPTPHVNPSTPEEFLNSFKPIKGMEVDWSEKVDGSYRANIQDAVSSFEWRPPVSRWSGFDLGAWFQNKMNNGWGSSGPVNAGPPKVLEKIDPDAALQLRQWENVGVQQFLTSYSFFKMSVADTAGGAAYSQDDFERALNLKETSGWYLAVAGTLGVAWWNLAMGESSSSGTAAVALPRGGTAVREVAVKEAKLNQLKATDDAIAKREAAVADQVTQLTAATTAVTKQLAELNAAKAQRDYDVATMKSDLREMRNELYVTARSEKELRASLQRTQAQLESETASLRKQLEERIAAEAAVQEQLKANKTKMEKELKTIAAAKDQAEQEVVQAKKQVTVLEKEKKAMEQEIATLQAQVQDLQGKLDGPKKTATKGSKAAETPASPPVAKKAAVPEKKESPTPAKKAKKETVVAKKEEPKKATAKEPKKAVAKKIASKKATAKKAVAKKAVDTEQDVLANLSKAFFANITEPVG